MMPRRTAIKLLGASALMTVKLGTVAPKSSPWGQLLSVWETALKEKSRGRLVLQIFYNGQQGDEGAIVGTMKAGQLDGAFVSAVGLSKIHKPILALHMPGLFASWTKLDAARDAMKAELEKGVLDAAFTMLGWGDIGATHVMSKGFEVRTPVDLRARKPYPWRDDAIDPVFFEAVGGVRRAARGARGAAAAQRRSHRRGDGRGTPRRADAVGIEARYPRRGHERVRDRRARRRVEGARLADGPPGHPPCHGARHDGRDDEADPRRG